MGLLYPSRKNYPWTQDRTGAQLLPQKRQTDTVSIDIDTAIPGTVTQTVLVVPQGKQASLTYFQILVRNTGVVNSVSLLIDDVRAYLLVFGIEEVSFTFRYEEAIRFTSSMKLQIAAGGAASPAVSFNAFYVEEPAGEGYFS
jgi:hypothetical protein